MELGSALRSLAPPAVCSEMLGVAEEAFRAGNFELAAEIYGSQLEELPKPERSLWLRKGDALALAGKVADALDSYTRAATLSQLRPEELGVLVGSIALNIREKELKLPCAKTIHDNGYTNELCQGPADPSCTTNTPVLPQRAPGSDIFSCPVCRLLLLDPVTLTCGHTYCKRCLGDKKPRDCISCHIRAKCKPEGSWAPCQDLKVNVVLGSLLEKWLGEETRVRRLSVEGEILRQKNSLIEALEKFSTALDLAPCDSVLRVERAEIYLAMKNFKQALNDAEVVCRKQPHWQKGHYVKAQALSGLGRTEEALKEFLYCVALNPEWSSVKTEAQKDSVFRLTKASFPESDLLLMKDFPDCSQSCDLPMDKAVNSLGSVLACLPGASLKRKLASTSEDLPSLQTAAKVLKIDAGSLCEQPASECTSRVIPKMLVDACDFECSLCMRLFYEPVATPCGHTFCLKCLERCLDHNPHCPLCKENLSQYLASRAYKKTLLTEELLTRYLPEELTERKKIYDEEIRELSNLNKDVPIFVCTMAFPTIPCPLHVFEPRYRLMIRRSMETGTKQFGMCIADELKGFADYGCMLQVRDVKFFPDGRSVVDTVGLSRFKVLSHGQRDGYNTANIEYLEDKKVEGQEYEELLLLHNTVYDQALAWFTSLKDNMKAQILSHFGPMPSKESDPQASTCGPAWCWWMLAVLPLENKAQLTILAMTSLKDRLLAIRRILIFVTRKRPR
ncbi:LON peptidase N-terminal domain and RING finger protein 2 isoform 2-T2 [Rhinophrynus dorsalis]